MPHLVDDDADPDVRIRHAGFGSSPDRKRGLKGRDDRVVDDVVPVPETVTGIGAIRKAVCEYGSATSPRVFLPVPGVDQDHRQLNVPSDART